MNTRARTRAAGRIDHMSDGDDTALATGDVDLATMSTPAATSAPTDSRKTKFNSQDVPAPDLTLKEEERRKRAEEASKSAQAKPAVKTGYLGAELRTASKNGDSNKVQELLNAGADPNSPDSVIRWIG